MTWLKRTSMRTRLILMLLILPLVATALVSWGSISTLQDTWRDNARLTLLASQASLNRNIALLTQDPEGLLIREDDGTEHLQTHPAPNVFHLAQMQGDGAQKVYSGEGEAGSIQLSEQQIAQVVQVPYLGGGPRNLHIEGAGDFLVSAEYLWTTGPNPLRVRAFAGISLDGYSQTVDGLILRQMAIGLAIGVVAAALGALLVVRFTRPLGQVTAAANEVSGLPLATDAVQLPRRIEVPDPNSRAEADHLAVAFNRMLDHVDRSLADRQKTEESMRRFVAEASHELRNPLAAISGYAEFYSEDKDTGPEVTIALQRIGAESQRLSALVDNLMLLSQLDSGATAVSGPVPLTQIVVEVAADSRITYPEHLWHLDLPSDPVEVSGVEDSLRRILINLTANAGRHTPAGTTVMVRLESMSDHLLLSVEDDGPGMPPEALATIFDRFTQARVGVGETRDHSSMGLGLAIVKALSAQSGYDVAVSSRPGHTIFALRIPSKI